MAKHRSFRSKAVHFVADLTTDLLNPISDKPSSRLSPSLPPPPEDEIGYRRRNQLEPITEEQVKDLVDEPDTSSLTAFLYSLLVSDPKDKAGHDKQEDSQVETSDKSWVNAGTMKETDGKKSLLSKYKQALRFFYQAAKFGGFKSQEKKSNSDVKQEEETENDGLEMKHMQNVKEETMVQANLSLPEASEPSRLLSERTRQSLYASLPALIQGRKWLLLYSTWRHGISLSTLYRKSLLWPGLSLLVVGDRKGTVFGGLVEAPLIPTDKKYQGGNNTFVFTNKSGQPIIFRPTGANRLNGSSAYSETYGNPCLSNSQDFEIKEVELWGFVYGSKYEEILALSKTVEPGICRW
ncbi:PREDICTED: TLD domain-containing protein 2 isoform X2 [Tarenaya hassleriana]|uniref:TLD domain-containing protein 2 isoform X2 n=1 Tax=Tarenaya hassleriana TaxID=28532 RepID=UPI00053C97AD|nr:PREDICTED: TLD domain-containing protein 2 isoform X2 [Tarenaya hassleriana]